MILCRCGGRLLLLDVGMSTWIGGHLAGLRCSKKQGLVIVSPDGEQDA